MPAAVRFFTVDTRGVYTEPELFYLTSKYIEVLMGSPEQLEAVGPNVDGINRKGLLISRIVEVGPTVYEPTDLDLQIFPDPDIRAFGEHSARGLDGLYIWLGRTQRTIPSLTWAERVLLSLNAMPEAPYDKPYNDSIYEPNWKYDQDMLLHEWFRMQQPALSGLYVTKGVIAAKILSKLAIPGSISGQKLITVDVDDDRAREIICAGTDVLQVGSNIAIALPGARHLRLDKDGQRKPDGKIRTRHFHIGVGNVAWSSEGVALSQEEVDGNFYDQRLTRSGQVLVLPHTLGLRPGVSLDNKVLTNAGRDIMTAALPKLTEAQRTARRVDELGLSQTALEMIIRQKRGEVLTKMVDAVRKQPPSARPGATDDLVLMLKQFVVPRSKEDFDALND